MMTVELRHIHIGMMAVADNLILGFGDDATAGDGKDFIACKSSTSLTSDTTSFSLRDIARVVLNGSSMKFGVARGRERVE